MPLWFKWFLIAVCLLLGWQGFAIWMDRQDWYPKHWYRQAVYGQFYCPSESSPSTVADGVVSGRMSQAMLASLRISGVQDVKLTSPGGQISTIDNLPKQSKSVRVVGPVCSSACAWMAALHENVCVDQSLPELRFHTAISSWCHPDGSRVVVEQATQNLLNRVSPALRARLSDLLPAGQPAKDKIVAVSREEFLVLFPEKACN